MVKQEMRIQKQLQKISSSLLVANYVLNDWLASIKYIQSTCPVTFITFYTLHQSRVHSKSFMPSAVKEWIHQLNNL